MRALASTTSFARSSLSRTSLPSASWRIARGRGRDVHTLPTYNFPVENGLGDFLSPRALQTIAVDYQGGLLTRLNELVKGTNYESLSVVTTVVESAKDPKDILTFNMASQALNNSFFLDNLTTRGNTEQSISQSLRNKITTELGSLSQLKSNFGATALGMSSSGWVWLVVDSSMRLAIVPTYGSGTALVRGMKMSVPTGWTPSVEMASSLIEERAEVESTPGTTTSRTRDVTNTPPFPTSSLASSSPNPNPTPFPSGHQQIRHFSSPSSPTRIQDIYRPSRFSRSPSGSSKPPTNSNSNATASLGGFGDKLAPLFCLSVHEHAWLVDYGVWGKEEYVRRFWDTLDWERVSALFGEIERSGMSSKPTNARRVL